METVTVDTYEAAKEQWKRVGALKEEMMDAANGLAHFIDAFADELPLSPGTREALDAYRAARKAWNDEPRPEVR